MARKTEAEFVNEGLTDEEIETLGTGTAASDNRSTIQPQADVLVDANAAPDAAQQQPAPQEPKMVDVRALQEARAAQRAAQEELAKFRNEQSEQSKKDAVERARLEERIALINQAMSERDKAQVKVPTKDEDPLGYYDHKLSEADAKMQALEKMLAEREETEKKRAQEFEVGNQQVMRNRTVVAEADAVLNRAIADNPQVKEAVDFAFDGMRNDIMNYMETNNVPYGQRQLMADQMLNNMVIKLAAECPRDPVQASNFVMRHARFYGYGYQPQQDSQSQPAQPRQQPSTQPVTPQQRAEQQQRHLSLSGTQGGQPPAQLNAKALADMSDEQFTALMKTVDGRKKVDSILAGN